MAVAPMAAPRPGAVAGPPAVETWAPSSSARCALWATTLRWRGCVAEVVRFIDSSAVLSRPGPKARGTRPLIVLLGDHSARPDGLERDLLRAGFQVAEADDIAQLPGRPAL